MKDVEGWGGGVSHYFEKCNELGLPPPKVEELDGGFFRVTFYRSVIEDGVALKVKDGGREDNREDNEDNSELDGLTPGMRVKVGFAVDGREWTDPKTGKARYFADLTALRLEQLNGTAQVPKVPVPGNEPEELDDGDVPFQNLGRTTTAFCKVRW